MHLVERENTAKEDQRLVNVKKAILIVKTRVDPALHARLVNMLKVWVALINARIVLLVNIIILKDRLRAKTVDITLLLMKQEWINAKYVKMIRSHILDSQSAINVMIKDNIMCQAFHIVSSY